MKKAAKALKIPAQDIGDLVQNFMVAYKPRTTSGKNFKDSFNFAYNKYLETRKRAATREISTDPSLIQDIQTTIQDTQTTGLEELQYYFNAQLFIESIPNRTQRKIAAAMVEGYTTQDKLAETTNLSKATIQREVPKIRKRLKRFVKNPPTI